MKLKKVDVQAINERIRDLEFKNMMPRYDTCDGCGHLALRGHVTSRMVDVRERQNGDIVSYRKEFYGKQCDPGYDLREQDMDGSWRYFVRDGETYKPATVFVEAPSARE